MHLEAASNSKTQLCEQTTAVQSSGNTEADLLQVPVVESQ